MRSILIAALVLLLFFNTFTSVLSSKPELQRSVDTAPAQLQAITTSNFDFVMEYTITFSENEILLDTIQGFDRVKFVDAGCTTEPGKPMVPVKFIRIALPKDMKVADVKILTMKEKLFEGTYTLYPAQPPQPISIQTQATWFHPPDSTIYTSNISYPPEYIKFNRQADLAGQNIAEVTIYPIHYTGAYKRLTFMTSLTFLLEGTAGYHCGDYLSAQASNKSHDMYEQMVKDLVINPEEVRLRHSPSPHPLGVSPGNYEYVIITTDGWVSAFQPLADWKTKKGVPATIVTTSWIYTSGGYSGTTAQKLRAFVIDAHEQWDAVFFLLGGDTDTLPAYTKNFTIGDTTYEVPSDTYYADYDDDWVCEVHVGRASVRSITEITTFITKVLTYEKTPPLTNYAKTVFFCGFDLTDYGSGEGQDCSVSIKDIWIPSDWTSRWEYDNETTNHKTEVLTNLNLGSHLVNHIDHSNTDFMGTGYTNHNQGITTNDAFSRSNGNKQSIIYSIGCYACDYLDVECIAEGFVHNTYGGAVAFIGNSRNGWYLPYNSDYDSLRFDRYFFRSLFNQNHYNLGVTFSDHKNDAYSDPGAGSLEAIQHIFYGLTLLGDPEMPIWTETPITMTASYPHQIPRSPSEFTVTVTSNGTPVNQASVCLWKGTDLYLTGVTNSAGQKTFPLVPTTPGLVYVTVTKQNHLPYEGSATVVNQPPVANFTYFPINPRTIDSIQFIDASTDSDGTISAWSWSFGDGTTSTLRDPQHQYADNGTYLVTLTVTDNDGGRHERTKPINVSNVPPAVSFTSYPFHPTTSTTIQFNDTSADVDGTITSWSWDFGDGRTSRRQNTSHQYADDGSYTVALTVTDDDGAVETKSTSILVSNVPPSANFSYQPSHPDTSDTIQFTDTSTDSDGTIISWLWIFGDGGTSTQQHASHTYSDNKVYTILLIVTDDDQATNATTQSISIQNTPPVANFTFDPRNPEIHERVTFNSISFDNDGVISNYMWDFGDGTKSYTQKTTHSYAENGTYLVTLNVTDNDGDTDTRQTVILVSPNAPPRTPSSPSPTNGSHTVPLSTHLNWSGGDPNYDPVTYDVYFGTTNPPDKIRSNQSDTMYDPGVLNFTTTYYWKIVAWDTHGLQTLGPTWQFTTRTNHPPIATPDNYSTSEDTTLLVLAPGVLRNDYDSDDDPLTMLKVSDTRHGSILLNTNGSFRYIPTANYYGIDTFTYRVSDGYIYSAPVNVTLRISAVNDPPVLGVSSPGNGSIINKLSLTWSIPINDVEGDPFSWTIQCSNGQSNSSTRSDNGTKTLSLAGLAYSTTYKIWVNATDPTGSNQGTRKWYAFTPRSSGSGNSGGSSSGGGIPPQEPENKKPIAHASAGEPYQGYVNTEVTFDGSKSYDPDGNITVWFWTFGDGTNGTGKITTHSYNTIGNWTVTLTVTDNNGKIGIDTTYANIIENPNVKPTADFSFLPIDPTTDDTVQFTELSTDTDGTIASFSWSFGDGTTSTGKNTEHRYNTSGIYQVTLSVTDDDGAFASTYKMITVDTSRNKDVTATGTEETPGFELFFILCATAVAIYLKKKKRSI